MGEGRRRTRCATRRCLREQLAQPPPPAQLTSAPGPPSGLHGGARDRRLPEAARGRRLWACCACCRPRSSPAACRSPTGGERVLILVSIVRARDGGRAVVVAWPARGVYALASSTSPPPSTAGHSALLPSLCPRVRAARPTWWGCSTPRPRSWVRCCACCSSSRGGRRLRSRARRSAAACVRSGTRPRRAGPSRPTGQGGRRGVERGSDLVLILGSGAQALTRGLTVSPSWCDRVLGPAAVGALMTSVGGAVLGSPRSLLVGTAARAWFAVGVGLGPADRLVASSPSRRRMAAVVRGVGTP